MCGFHSYENRTTAIRVPGGAPKARRIEHRVAGGDANPYLMIAAILGAALTGMEGGKEATNPISGNSYEVKGTSIINDWKSAIQCFSSSEKIKGIFDPLLIRSFIDCKTQEFNYFNTKSVDEIKQITINAI